MHKYVFSAKCNILLPRARIFPVVRCLSEESPPVVTDDTKKVAKRKPRAKKATKKAALEHAQILAPAVTQLRSQHLPWLNPESKGEIVAAKVQQKKDLRKEMKEKKASEKPVTIAQRRQARSSAGSSAAAGKLASQNEGAGDVDDAGTGIDFGLLGGKEVHWYALWTNERREMQAAEQLKKHILNLPTRVVNSSGQLVPRTCEVWVPSKKVTVWNMLTQKPSTTTVLYEGDGGWVFLRCIMDNQVHDLIETNLSIRKYRFDKLALSKDGESMPEPCTQEFMDSVQGWVDHVESLTDDDFKLKTYGQTTGPLAGYSSKIDKDLEHVEIIDTGRTKKVRGKDVAILRKEYKNDEYSGTWNNPSNWFESDPNQHQERVERDAPKPEKRAPKKPRQTDDFKETPQDTYTAHTDKQGWGELSRDWNDRRDSGANWSDSDGWGAGNSSDNYDAGDDSLAQPLRRREPAEDVSQPRGSAKAGSQWGPSFDDFATDDFELGDDGWANVGPDAADVGKVEPESAGVSGGVKGVDMKNESAVRESVKGVDTKKEASVPSSSWNDDFALDFDLAPDEALDASWGSVSTKQEAVYEDSWLLEGSEDDSMFDEIEATVQREDEISPWQDKGTRQGSDSQGVTQRDSFPRADSQDARSSEYQLPRDAPARQNRGKRDFVQEGTVQDTAPDEAPISNDLLDAKTFTNMQMGDRAPRSSAPPPATSLSVTEDNSLDALSEAVGALGVNKTRKREPLPTPAAGTDVNSGQGLSQDQGQGSGSERADSEPSRRTGDWGNMDMSDSAWSATSKDFMAEEMYTLENDANESASSGSGFRSNAGRPSQDYRTVPRRAADPVSFEKDPYWSDQRAEEPQARAKVEIDIQVGDRIRGTGGAFADFDGVVKSVAEDGSLEASFDCFGLTTTASVPHTNVVKIA